MAELLQQVGAVSSTSGHALNYAAAVNDDLAAPRATLPATTRLTSTSEMGDFIKAGGLGEVSSALPRQLRALRRAGADPGLSAGPRGLPEYRRGAADAAHRRSAAMVARPGSARQTGLRSMSCSATSSMTAKARPTAPMAAAISATTTSASASFRWRCRDRGRRGRPELEAHDIIHVNDWPSALAAGYLRWKGLSTPSILTIHNLAYQGLYAPVRLARLGIPDLAYSVNGVEFHGNLVPEERHLLCLACHHGERDLCPRNHHAPNMAAAAWTGC